MLRKKPRLILICFLCGVVLLSAFWHVGRKVFAEEYKNIWSPDGNYKIVVYSFPTIVPSMPGQSGDASGFVRICDKGGRVLEEKNIEMVQIIDHVYWEDDKVDVKLFAEWKLPR